MPNDLITLSADGKLLSGQTLGDLEAGDTFSVILDGKQLVGGAEAATILGHGRTFLKHSLQLNLCQFEPQADGTCRLSYQVTS
ncbi:hypothetical protein JIN77_02785 [Verrucomicrobiaceae bacterium R5-34]|uniref:Uncharacterized protein n=1 Tax=Oceaniferula flava TaxID=2800421 RepID=A0AAE2VCX4_9BACT|nr:hypothetical protein [Oceaniferula flavus]MBK1829638.1 hypothetical protein [Verrucomicrobiaceae bacterium R5-34]MBK1853829.1 hypothetical protein [Oceaniferula flavus]MBM1135135.1 hypothetical protein [Oceaniferula flavus]